MRTIKFYYRIVREFTRTLEANSVRAYSAAAAFFAIISLSPFALILAQLKTAPVALFSAAGISALWAASHCMFTVIRGLNKIAEVRNSRNHAKQRLLSVLYTLALQFMLTISLSLFGIVVLFVLFALLYRMLPARSSRGEKRPKWRSVAIGAAFAAVGWSGFSYGYSLYVERYANFSEVYGSFAATAATMLWLYFCMSILFIGAQINASIKAASLTPPRSTPELTSTA